MAEFEARTDCVSSHFNLWKKQGAVTYSRTDQENQVIKMIITSHGN